MGRKKIELVDGILFYKNKIKEKKRKEKKETLTLVEE